MKRLTFLLIFLASQTISGFGQNCSISIISIDNEPNNTIKGNVTPINGCDTIVVTICCPQNSTPCKTQYAVVQNDGNWATTFKNSECRCNPDSLFYYAHAYCLNNISGCTVGKKIVKEKCQTDPCSSVIDVITTIGGCIDDTSGCKKRQVTFNPLVSGNCVEYKWTFGDGETLYGNGNPSTVVHPYFYPIQIGSPPPQLSIKRQLGCDPVWIDYNIQLGTFSICSDCESPIIDFSQVQTEGCKIGGKILADFCEEHYPEFYINFGDGVISPGFDANILNNFEIGQINHTYASNGNKNISVHLKKDGGYCIFSKTININGCIPTTTPTDDGKCNIWEFWECFEWNWCWILALLAFLFISARIVLVAEGWSINVPFGQNLSGGAILEALGGSFILALMMACPCETAIMVLAGAVSGLLFILVASIFFGATFPKWLEALIIGIALIAAMAIAIEINGC